MPRVLKRPDLEWGKNGPICLSMEAAPEAAPTDGADSGATDIYFSSNPQESFLSDYFSTNRLEERFSNFQKQGSSRFVIIELGFGAGVNFFFTLNEWLKRTKVGHLHYIGIENRPLAAEHISRASSELGFGELSREFIQPELFFPVEGFYTKRSESSRTSLHLACYEADEILSWMASNEAKSWNVDAIYLDGFSPSKNPSMWSEEIAHHLREISGPETSLGSYSVARSVRDNFQKAGWQVERKSGTAKKRDVLVGSSDLVSSTSGAKSKLPKKVAIVGSGFSGAFLANALARRGLEVSVFEKADSIAAGASGNPAAIAIPYVSNQSSPQHRLFLEAWRYFLINAPSSFKRTGAIQLSYSDRLDKVIDQLGAWQWPEEEAQVLSIDELSDIAGTKLSCVRGLRKGLYYPSGGYIDPRELCRSLLEQDGIQIHLESPVTVNEIENDFDAVVLCTASETLGASLGEESNIPKLPVSPLRGQCLNFKTSKTEPPKTVVCGHAYITPANSEGSFLIGATYSRDNLSLQPSKKDSEEILEKTFGMCPDLQPSLVGSEARASLRCSVRDRMPIVGKLRTSAKDKCPVYGLVGLGSRGLTLSSLLSEVLAAEIFGEPPPCSPEVVATLGAERFGV